MNCRLNVRRIDPVENCLDIPRFNCAATLSMVVDNDEPQRTNDQFKDQNHIIASFGDDDDVNVNDRAAFFFFF